MGTVFLAAVFPLAFSALLGDGEGSLRQGHRLLAVTRTSQSMNEVAAGYFVYDVVICLFKLAGQAKALCLWCFYV